jgi:ABC-2 type transport system permease protein
VVPFVAPLIYGVFYPQPYLAQILREIPIAVVDNDLSELSHRIVQALEASGAVRVAVRAETHARLAITIAIRCACASTRRAAAANLFRCS